MSPTVLASLFITYAVVQTVVFLLLVRFVDLYEREPLSVVALMALWGAIGAAALSALGNIWIAGALPTRIDIVFGRAISAPVVEELSKGIALVAFVALSIWAAGRFRIHRFEGVTDGIVYGAAIGLGFAFTEDVLYLLLGASEGGLQSGFVDFLQRRDFFGLSMLRHAIYTAAFGAGLGLATWGRRAKVTFPLLGILTGMTLHSLNNGLPQVVLTIRYGLDNAANYLLGVLSGPLEKQMDATARASARVVNGLDFVLVGLFGLAILLWLAYQRRVIRAELAEEASLGLISHTELDLLPSYWRRNMWYWQLIRSGQWERLRVLKRIHNELVTFALLKRRSRNDPEPDGEVERTRRLIAKLKAQKVVFF